MPDVDHFPLVNVEVNTIGEAWLDIARDILARGHEGTYDGAAMREALMATLHVARPASRDELIELFAEPERLAWMHANFTDPTRVAELGDAASYATRLYDYENRGLDQIAGVVKKLIDDPTTRNAAITTFQPLSDTSYIPCVSVLDFFIDGGRLALSIYAHSIDFGAKGYANLVELAHIQEHVANAVGLSLGPLTMIVKSAHVYESELDYVRNVLAKTGRA
ncbi:MAG: thymidylate synthase [Acidimicrobiales bacterium]